MCSLLPRDLHSELISFSLQLLLCLVAAVKRLPMHHHSADYIFSGLLVLFGIGLILSQFENRVLLVGSKGRGQCCTITLLHMNRLNKTESAIFVFLMYFLLPKDLYSELFLC